MAVQAGFSGTLEASSDGSSYDSIGGANSVSPNLSRAMLEVTDFDDTAVNRIAGLKDSSISVSGHYDGADAGQSTILTEFESGDDVYIRYRPDGTTGFVIQGKVESFNLSTDVSGTATFDCSIQANTAFTIES